MCNEDEVVEMVKAMTAELFREQRELVERLNAMHERIEAESQPVSKVRRKVEWMEEKERSVEQLNTMIASLQGVLEADVATGEMAAAADKTDTFAPASPKRPFRRGERRHGGLAKLLRQTFPNKILRMSTSMRAWSVSRSTDPS
ncbi:hypothetical protein T484DRAFT_1837778 [Baffinella frigidus]|nr:hypothetical protein T484DRAFT_1837778 [Cryptophyta sp. CCMP2293]